MNLGDHSAKLSAFLTLATLTLVAAILYFAKPVFIPVALTALLSFLLAPLVVRLMRWKLPRAVAVITSVTFAFSIIGVIGWLVTTQTLQLIERLPKYQDNLQAKISSLKKPRPPAFITRANDMVKELKRELETDSKNTGPPPDLPATGQPAKEPIPVEVKAPKPTAFQLARTVFGPILSPLGTLGIAIVLTIMVLFQREDLRDRFIKLVSGGDLNVATQAVDDAAQRISRYLLTTLALNAMYGIPVAIALYFIGVPNALLWGLLCMLLRFIPYLGPWVAASFPILLSVAVDPGWTMFLFTAGMFLLIETISNNFLEPWLYGNTTGVSNVALIVAAIFWTWLWGPIGLFLSTPLTVCLMVMGKYAPGLEFLSVLLGSQPVLEPHARFYQRMLAMDEEEMLNLALEYRTQYSLEDFYDQILVPALIMAEEDRHNGTLAEVRQKFIIQGTRDLIDELAQEEDAPPVAEGEPIMCVPARDDADELAGLMLRHILARRGVAMKVLSVASLPADSGESVRHEGARTVCVSALPPAATIPARNVCKRLKQQDRNLTIIAGIWSPEAVSADLQKRLAPWANIVVTRLKDAAEQFAPEHRAASTTPDVTFHLDDVEPEEARDAVVRELANTFNVPVSLVSVVDRDKEFWGSRFRASADDGEREDTVCNQLESIKDVVVVEDISKDPKFADNNFLEERGVKFLASTPLQLPDGHTVGSLCVMDTKPHTVTEREKQLLAKVAEEFMRVLSHRRLQAA